MIALDNVMPGLKLKKDNYEVMARAFKDRNNLDQALEVIKNHVGKLDASKYMMVAFILTHFYDLQRKLLAPCQSYLWHCLRLENLKTVLEYLEE